MGLFSCLHTEAGFLFIFISIISVVNSINYLGLFAYSHLKTCCYQLVLILCTKLYVELGLLFSKIMLII